MTTATRQSAKHIGKHIARSNKHKCTGALTAGGLDEISYVTRLIPATSFVIREDTFLSTSGGKIYQSAVIKSVDSTARRAITSKTIFSDRLKRIHSASGGEAHLIIRPLIPHNTHRPHGQQHRERLRDLVIQPRIPDLADEYVVRELEDLDLLARNWAEDADGEARPGEGMPLHKGSGDGEESAEGADFVCVCGVGWSVKLKTLEMGGRPTFE